MGYDVCAYNSYGIVRFLALAFVDDFLLWLSSEPNGDRREIVRGPCDAREDSVQFLAEPVRSSCDRRMTVCPKIIIKNLHDHDLTIFTKLS